MKLEKRATTIYCWQFTMKLKTLRRLISKKWLKEPGIISPDIYQSLYAKQKMLVTLLAVRFSVRNSRRHINDMLCQIHLRVEYFILFFLLLLAVPPAAVTLFSFGIVCGKKKIVKKCVANIFHIKTHLLTCLTRFMLQNNRKNIWKIKLNLRNKKIREVFQQATVIFISFLNFPQAGSFFFPLLYDTMKNFAT